MCRRPHGEERRAARADENNLFGFGISESSRLKSPPWENIQLLELLSRVRGVYEDSCVTLLSVYCWNFGCVRMDLLPACLESLGLMQRTYDGSLDMRISMSFARLALNCVAA